MGKIAGLLFVVLLAGWMYWARCEALAPYVGRMMDRENQPAKN